MKYQQNKFWNKFQFKNLAKNTKNFNIYPTIFAGLTKMRHKKHQDYKKYNFVANVRAERKERTTTKSKKQISFLQIPTKKLNVMENKPLSWSTIPIILLIYVFQSRYFCKNVV